MSRFIVINTLDNFYCGSICFNNITRLRMLLCANDTAAILITKADIFDSAHGGGNQSGLYK